MSACADLHPDPAEEGSEDIEIDGGGGVHSALPDRMGGGNGEALGYEQVDGLPPPMPGSGGWITAENVGRLFDEEGNLRGVGGGGGGGGAGGGLGPGAGVVRGREEDGGDGDDGGREGGEQEGEGGEDAGGEGVNGGEGETKWRRTG